MAPVCYVLREWQTHTNHINIDRQIHHIVFRKWSLYNVCVLWDVSGREMVTRETFPHLGNDLEYYTSKTNRPKQNSECCTVERTHISHNTTRMWCRYAQQTCKFTVMNLMGWWGGSIGRASTQDPKTRGLNPFRSTITKFVSYLRVKMLCWLIVSVPNPRVYTHAYEWPRTHVKDPVVRVRVWWITEAWKDPACTRRTG